MRLKKNKKRTGSQNTWLYRNLKDKYVAKANKEGYRSRSAYKLIEINEKFNLFKKRQKILDLGAAPGGWSQVVAKIVGGGGKILAIDLLPMPPIDGVTFVKGDFRSDDITDNHIKSFGTFDGIMSDVAPAATGVSSVNHLQLVSMVEDMFPIIDVCLKPGGFFICKVFKGAEEQQLFEAFKKKFKKASRFKPKASRERSVEEYFVAFSHNLV